MNKDHRRYSIIPFWTLPVVKTATEWKVLAASGAHASPLGILYASQDALGALVGVDQAHVSRAVKSLYEKEVLRLLLPKGKKHPKAWQRSNRMQLCYDGPRSQQPMPSAKEIEIAYGHRTGRWP